MLKNFKVNFRCLSNYRLDIRTFLLSLQPEKKASLAQLVEQLTRNEQVVGSSPMGGSKKKNPDIMSGFSFLAITVIIPPVWFF